MAETGKAKETKRAFRITAWAVYLAGIPAWLWIFIQDKRWIAAALEFGGAPAMLLGLVFGRERGRQFVKFALHDRVDLVQREVDAVVGDAALWKIVGTDAVRAVAAADQALAGAGLLRVLGTQLLVLEAGGEHREGLGTVAVL